MSDLSSRRRPANGLDLISITTVGRNIYAGLFHQRVISIEFGSKTTQVPLRHASADIGTELLAASWAYGASKLGAARRIGALRDEVLR